MTDQNTPAGRNLPMPDLPPPTSTYGRVWEDGDLDISAEEDGAVLIEYTDGYDGDIRGTQTSRMLTLTRAQVLAVLAASEWNPNDQH